MRIQADRVAPAPGDWPHACRVAIGLLVPGLALVAAGHPELIISTVVAFAFAGALMTLRLDLTPRGPFFGIFALGATATVPSRVPPQCDVAGRDRDGAAVPHRVVHEQALRAGAGFLVRGPCRSTFRRGPIADG
ncbi:hypothetical protein [Amycolatopsis sp. cmx-11-12]|uniref:hypothetical protein n=1 Tax=Amycolatopsis sp. cmx-11-12 TaxID=2785795 RepID=UPI003917EE05